MAVRQLKFRAWLGGVMHPKWERIDEAVYKTHPDIKIMQFTGLLDKQGVEIYNGDIVRIEHPCWSAKCKTVFFDGAFFFVELDNPVENSQIRADKILKERWKIKVIGNDFQSPELLTNNK